MAASHTAPVTAADMAAALADAARASRRVVPVGAATKLAWHDDPFETADTLSTRGLLDGFAHYAGDLVATIPAGMTLAEANARLAAAGQWLPVDPLFADRATIGGIVATNDSGPRRYRHGAPRDLIVGIEVALADGRVVHAGGRVVKNVAGYDLSRLFCGSHGSLGVVTSATFKLVPLAADSCTLVARLPTLAAALACAQALAHSPLTPSAIELQAPDPVLLIRFETTATARTQMLAATNALLQPSGAETQVVHGDAEHAVWTDHDRRISASTHTLLKVSVLPSAAVRVFTAWTPGVQWAANGRAALGVFVVRLQGTADHVATEISRLRRAAELAHGHLTMLDAPPDVKRLAGPSPEAPAAALMQAVKARFDPHAVLRRVCDGR